MDYSETISWLTTQLPMYQRIGKAAYKPNLDNTVAILSALGNPENKFRAIHVAGTNGKGSVSHMIASVLQEAGYKTGLYTSPHLKDFRERIKINGQLIPKQKVIEFVENNKNTFTNIKSSFFEMTVGMAFDYFANEKVDFAVIETGLGGRLDSTNLCKPVISIITNIGIDHTAFLGDTLEQIAIEKAGIIKPNIPVVIGRHQKGIDNIFKQKSAQLKSPIFFVEDNISMIPSQQKNNNAQTINVQTKDSNSISNLKIPLLGNYQIENVCTALYAINILNKYAIVKITTNNIRNGFENVIDNTGLFGRWQILNTNPLTICDTGHNIDGISAVVQQLAEQNYNKLLFVLGMVNDKDLSNIINILPKHANYYFCRPNIPRGLDADILKQKAKEFKLIGKSYNTVTEAYKAAKTDSKSDDLIFIGGSTFVVAEVV